MYVAVVIRDVLLNGVADIDIQCDAPSTDDIHKKSITDIISFIKICKTDCQPRFVYHRVVSTSARQSR